MIYLLLLWFCVWSLMRLLKTEPAQTVVLIIGLLLALVLVFGFPHIGRIG